MRKKITFTEKLKKFLNWSSKPKPQITLSQELFKEFLYFRIPIISIVVLSLIGALGYVLIDDFSIMDAIYQATITFTTVGYTEIAPISTAGRFFTILYIILSFVVFMFSIGIILDVFNRGVLAKLLRERHMLYKIAMLKRHFVICYHNDYTIELTKQFRENHIPFVVVDNDENFEAIAKANKYPYFVKEAPHSDLSWLKTHLASAKGVITLSNSVADNIAVTASVKLFEKEIGRGSPYFIMAIADNKSDKLKLEKIGANSVVLPSLLAAQRLSAVSVRPDMDNLLEQYLYKKDSPIDIEEIYIPDYSWIRFKRLKETHFRELANVDVIGIRDANGSFLPMPKGDALIGTDSKLLIVGTASGIRMVKILINNKYKPQEIRYI